MQSEQRSNLSKVTRPARAGTRLGAQAGQHWAADTMPGGPRLQAAVALPVGEQVHLAPTQVKPGSKAASRLTAWGG